MHFLPAGMHTTPGDDPALSSPVDMPTTAGHDYPFTIQDMG
jgi:hypothetical protein